MKKRKKQGKRGRRPGPVRQLAIVVSPRSPLPVDLLISQKGTGVVEYGVLLPPGVYHLLEERLGPSPWRWPHATFAAVTGALFLSLFIERFACDLAADTKDDRAATLRWIVLGIRGPVTPHHVLFAAEMLVDLCAYLPLDLRQFEGRENPDGCDSVHHWVWDRASRVLVDMSFAICAAKGVPRPYHDDPDDFDAAWWEALCEHVVRDLPTLVQPKVMRALGKQMRENGPHCDALDLSALQRELRFELGAASAVESNPRVADLHAFARLPLRSDDRRGRGGGRRKRHRLHDQILACVRSAGAEGLRSAGIEGPGMRLKPRTRLRYLEDLESWGEVALVGKKWVALNPPNPPNPTRDAPR